MRIQIDQELQASVSEPAEIDDDFYGALQYISQDEYDCANDVDAALLKSARAVFRAGITVLDAVDPDEVPRWTVGFAQNVAGYHRIAFYGPGVGVQVTQDFQYYGALRDGEITSAPFYETGGETSKRLELEVPLTITCEDDPTWILPVKIDGRGIDARLRKTTGGNTFATWLMLARTTATERRVVLLGRVPWSTKLEAEADDQDKLHRTASPVPAFGDPAPLDRRYDAETIPPVGDGQDVPDLRVLEGHPYVQGHLTRNIGDQHPLIVQWIYNDDECAVKWEQATNPADVPNWLAG